ncbi:hypothetical protein N7455_007566 [Penicillium solitum]|uniref:uncharacterized protein n=1 Tax=Penicillium solitum TaxID=60172 RepID=UPI0032C45510|nr:hypothetical protein N7455_007566 [Penicillium solitum]
MQGQIRGLDQVAYVLLCLFQCDGVFENVMEIKEINVKVTYNDVHAKDTICIQLNLLVLQTGTNLYTLFLLLH